MEEPPPVLNKNPAGGGSITQKISDSTGLSENNEEDAIMEDGENARGADTNILVNESDTTNTKVGEGNNSNGEDGVDEVSTRDDGGG